jgi:hypothetical protein
MRDIRGSLSGVLEGIPAAFNNSVRANNIVESMSKRFSFSDNSAAA